MRDWIKALPLGLGLPIMIGAASVKPEDAVSNVAAWLHLLGVEHTPQWLSAPGADKRVIIGSMVLGAIYAGLVWGVPALRRLGPKPADSSELGELYLHGHADIRDNRPKSYLIS